MDFENPVDIQTLFEQVIDGTNIKNTDYKRIIGENLKRISNFLQIKKINSKNQKLNFLEEENEVKIEKFRIFDYDAKKFSISAKNIFSSNPLNSQSLEYELEKFITIESDEFYKNFQEILINKGKKLKVDKVTNSLIKFEKWCNLINGKNHDEVLMTIHHEGEYRENNSFKLYYLIRIRDKEIEIHLHDVNNEWIKFELFYSVGDKFVYKTEMNKKGKEIRYNYEKNYKNGKNLTKMRRILMNNYHIKKRVEEENTKREFLTNDEEYKEFSSEWYEITESNLTYGRKYFENSKHRKYDEDWWNYENSCEWIKEIKIRRNLDDGLGTKTHETTGYKEVNGVKHYEFNDKTIHDVMKNEYVTTKIGFNGSSNWDCFIVNNCSTNTNFVENKGKEKINGVLNEWYEKWHESPLEKFCHKWGKNNNSEWEEEWKETDSDNFLEKVCYKKCKFLNDFRHWYETWNEKYSKINHEQVEKTCFKSNEYEEMGWGDKLVNESENKWLHYYHYKNNSGNSIYREYYYECDK